MLNGLKHEYFLWVMVSLLSLMLPSCAERRNHKVAISEADSLNHISFSLRFKDLEASQMAAAAAKAVAEADGADEQIAQALNNQGFCAFMRMDFAEAEKLYSSAVDMGVNQIEGLVSDVGLMRLFFRTSRKEDFYYARNSAVKRLKRLEEENSTGLSRMTPKSIKNDRLQYALSEFYLTDAEYQHTVGRDSLKWADIGAIDVNELFRCDTTQWLFYEYMAGSIGLNAYGTDDNATVEGFGMLINSLMISRSKGNVGLEAKASLAVSEMLSDAYNMDLLTDERPDVIRLLAISVNDSQTDTDDVSLAHSYASRALALATQYGDSYEIARANYTLGRYLNAEGDAEGAVSLLDQALALVSDSVPELELRIREQLSLAYSMMGMKQESDENRAVYIDLLDYTRQDREGNLRKSDMEKKSSQLDFILRLVAVGGLMLMAFIVVMSRRWRKRNEAYLSDLKLKLRDKLLSTAADLENGECILALDDERVRLEKEQYVSRQHLADNKCQNIVKKACLSIVGGIVPYIDRMVNEITKLQSEAYVQQSEIKQEKLKYISELAAKINDYNEILSLWIRMKQGDINLNIENFGLNELFMIIAKGRRSFELKKQTLEVCESDSIVKADKALTLFMINTLTENARKYAGEGAVVRLISQETEKYVEVSVIDNGPGLPEEDINKILNEKVYDSGQIGVSAANDRQALMQSKGHGFGLMNCKGIIEKYRKTNPLFNICLFGIESKLGRGSRFFFRLPKGARKVIASLLLTVLLMSCGKPQVITSADFYEETAQDTLLLQQANGFADSVYFCNIRGDYEQALAYADSSLMYLNKHFTSVTGEEEPLLQLYNDNGYAAEEGWITNRFNSDYNILIDVRNETAIAALALQNFTLYDYNNALFAYVYKYVTGYDNTEEYCREMELTARHKVMGICLLGAIVAICLMTWYVVYYRHRILYRYNVEQLFLIYKSILTTATADNGLDVEKRLTEMLFVELNELLPISALTLAVCDDETKRFHRYYGGNMGDEDSLDQLLSQSFVRQSPIWARNVGEWSCIPLWTDTADGRRCVGVLAILVAQPSVKAEDLALLEIASDYLAVVLYNTVVRVKGKVSDIELAKDEASRIAHEENSLHVQNMVLDNCLSTIKHETIYYPNRIKQIADSLAQGKQFDSETERERIKTMTELVEYYKDIFTILSSQAARQLDDVTFRRGTIDVAEVVSREKKYFERMSKKQHLNLCMEADVAPGLKVVGDMTLIDYMLRCLADDALSCKREGRILISAKPDGDFVRFEFVDNRRSFTKEQLDLLFSPDAGHIKVDVSGKLTGAEFLVCKQIVREHDEFGGSRGCRINAEPMPESGIMIWWTLKNKKCEL